MSVTMELGDRVKDRITGFMGIVVARTKWLNGCTRITIQPETLKDGNPIETQCFDEPQLELIEPDAFKITYGKTGAQAPTSSLGGPRPSPVRAKDPV